MDRWDEIALEEEWEAKVLIRKRLESMKQGEMIDLFVEILSRLDALERAVEVERG